MATTATLGQRVEIPPATGPVSSLVARIKPRALAFEPMADRTRVYMPGKAAKVPMLQHLLRLVFIFLPRRESNGRFTSWLHRLRTEPFMPALPDWPCDVWFPEIYWKAADLNGKCRKFVQLVWKIALGYSLNLVFLGFFAFVYYICTQNGWVVHDWNTLLVPVLGLAGWTWLRHIFIRDSGEWLYRLTGGWLAFANPLSPRQQHIRQIAEYNATLAPSQPKLYINGPFVRALEKTKIIPSDAEADKIGWFRRLLQIAFSWFTVFIAAIPGFVLVFGTIGIIGLFNHVLYAKLMDKAPSYAAIFGGLMFGKMVFTRLAFMFQAMVIDLFKDHGWPMPAWLGFPSHIRAWYKSGLSPRSQGSKWWRIPVLLLGILFIAVGARVGYWILGHAPNYLQNHTLFDKTGFNYMIRGIRTSFIHWVTTLGPQFMHLLHRAHLAR